MKKFYFLLLPLLIALATIVKAQEDSIVKPLQLEMDSMFMSLDTTAMSTGFLYDKTIHFSAFSELDGQSSDTIYPEDWFEVYFELQNMALVHNSNPPLDTIKQKNALFYQNNTIPIMLIHYNYEFIKDSAIADNLLDTVNGQVVDVYPRSESPYEVGNLFAASISYQGIFNKDTINFLLSSDLFFTNIHSTLPDVEIDFDDGEGYRSIPWDENYTYILEDTVTRFFKIKLSVGGGEEVYENLTRYKKMKKNDNFDERGYIIGQIEYEGAVTTGIYTIQYGNDNGVDHTCIKKPIIVTDGIDFGTEEAYNGDPLYCVSGECGDVSWWDLRNGLNRNFIAMKTEAMPEIALAPTLIDDLRNRGYDVIFLDWREGATHMQKNAFMLIELIEIGSLGIS